MAQKINLARLKIIFSIAAFILFSTTVIGQYNTKNKYYRHLRYNHVSPYIELAGILPIDSITASKTSHYIFKYDNSSNKLVDIINNHYHTEKRHPLASIGVYRLHIDYNHNKEIRIFFDIKGNRMTNDRKVFKEEYLYDDNNFKYQLNFYDLENNEMESSWGITSYHWFQKDNLIIEKRYSLEGKSVNLSPYFDFGITGILLNKDGSSKAHYNLNKSLDIADNSVGVASYRDSYNSKGEHIEYRYYNAKDELTMNQWGFAVGIKTYDILGNNIKIKYFDTNNNIVNTRNVYSNATINSQPNATQKDSLQIKNLSLGYLIALQKMNPELMDSVLSDSLNKVTIGYNRLQKKQYAKSTTKDQMLEFSSSWNQANNKFPFHPSNEAIILDIYDHIATVKLISDNWVEYLQLIKLEEEWEIINLIWQYRDINMYENK